MIEKFSIKFDGRYKVTSTELLSEKVLELLQRIQLGVTYIKCNLIMKENEFSVGRSKPIYQISKKSYKSYHYKDIKEIYSFEQYDNCSVVLDIYKDELWFSYFQFDSKLEKENFHSKIASTKNEEISKLVKTIGRIKSVNETDNIYESIISNPEVYEEINDKKILVIDNRNRNSNDMDFEDKVDGVLINDDSCFKIQQNTSEISSENFEIYQEMKCDHKEISNNNSVEMTSSDSSLEKIIEEETIKIESLIDNGKSRNIERNKPIKLNSLGDPSDLLIINGSMYLSCKKYESTQIIVDSCDSFD